MVDLSRLCLKAGGEGTLEKARPGYYWLHPLELGSLAVVVHCRTA
jgi:hypothetical protein